MTDRAPPGRLRKVPKGLAIEIAGRIVGTLNSAGQSVYHTRHRGFLHAHPAIKQQADQLGVHRRSLERAIGTAIQAADPDLVKRIRMVRISKLINNHQMEKRRKVAAKLRRTTKKKASLYSF
jgi:hypothetical protein